ncbi:IS200/IS605 family transposase [Pseudolactococcus insecticola]|uniref:IS200/IS605 family transposase n=1 Tax=Pseudolactococcus insecticola TaxID=2709158 RepID=A0A6A0B7K0_9LACT|nr:IS200/IS605 family transposase [Lactococcus insecticola]GFH41262.1 IS200/IS605 family transposase [Lactococcus insecticola]
MSKKREPIHERGYVYNFHFHLVWVTKYRRSIFETPEQVLKMKTILYDIAKNNEVKIENLEVMPDHVHMLISFKPKYAPTSIVKSFKGTSARLWFTAFPETKQKLWGGHLWSNSYFMSTLGDMSRDTVANYIKNQRTQKAASGRPASKK